MTSTTINYKQKFEEFELKALYQNITTKILRDINDLRFKVKKTLLLWGFLSANILFLCGMIFLTCFKELAINFDLVSIFKVLLDFQFLIK